MAGLLYLFRLYVNHVESGLNDENIHRLLSRMEEKLYRIITVPAMSVAWMAGLCMLVLQPSIFFSGRWMHYKLLLVVLMTVVTVYGGRLMRKFKNRQPGLPSSKALRVINEIPTILMMIIIALVVFRP
jgi:putative membrane protein